MSRRRWWCLLGAMVIFCLGAAAEATPRKGRRIFALVVGVNHSSVAGVPALRYADDDAARYFELFSATAERIELLTRFDSSSAQLFTKAQKRAATPSRSQLLAALGRLRSAIAAARRRGYEAELFFVYGGHGHIDAEGRGFISLHGGERFTRQDLYRHVVRGTRATRVHLIIDACHARHLVGARGGDGHKRGWRPDRGGRHLDSAFEAFLARERYNDYAHLGVLLSSSADGKTHEWSRLQAGVFSHEVRSGLLGAADVNGDAIVSYAEMHAFLAAANKKVRHAKARIRAFVRAPAAKHRAHLLRWRKRPQRCRLDLDARDRGRLTIEDRRGLPYADLNKAAGGELHIVLLDTPATPSTPAPAAKRSTAYWVRRGSAVAALKPPPGCSSVRLASLQFSPDKSTSSRGSADDALRQGLFAVSFGEAFYEGFVTAVDFARLPVLQKRKSPDARTKSQPRRLWGWSAVGLAAAAALSSGVLAGLAVGNDSELDRRAAQQIVLDADDRALADRVSRQRTAAIILGGVAVAAGAAALYLLWPRSSAKTESSRPKRSAELAPLILPGGAGASLSLPLP